MFDRLKRYFTAAPASRPAPPDTAALPPPPPLAMPAAMSLEERVDMAARCRDCDILPKVTGAGEVVAEADGTRVQVTHNGLRVLADGYRGAWMTELIARCRGHHDPQKERVFHEVVARMPPQAVMIELGAWWSFHSLWFLKDAPGRRAIALEPDPERRALGEVNAARNGLAPEFVAGFAGGAPLASASFLLDGGRRVELPRVTVPGLMERHGIGMLDLLRCDTGGAELDVLRGCAGLLREGRIRTVVVATHHSSVSGDPLTHQRCLALIEECGGAVFAEHDVHESFSGDGLIAARFGPDQAGWPVIPLSLNRYSTGLFRNPLYELAELLDR
jgi:FkbM family methyltransferase